MIDNEERFTDEFEALWNENVKSRIRVYRPKEYLNWRYCERPDKDYKIWTLRDGNRLKAYIITSDSDRWNVSEGQIVDFQYESLNQILILLKDVLSYFRNNNYVFISSWFFTDEELFKKLKKLGFYSRSDFPFKYFVPQRQMLSRYLSDDLEINLHEKSNWALRSGDQDTY